MWPARRIRSARIASICCAEAGLRPTRQRLMLGEFLFSKGGRHVTADMIYTEAAEANMQISRATVYNTLNQFTEVGLLRQIGVDGSKSFFDTNPTAHHHFFVDRRRQAARRSRARRVDRSAAAAVARLRDRGRRRHRPSAPEAGLTFDASCLRRCRDCDNRRYHEKTHLFIGLERRRDAGTAVALHWV